MKKQRGFTLSELLMVVTIIGILSALAVAIYADNVRSAIPLGFRCRRTGNGIIGSWITVSPLLGLKFPWGEPLAEDGFDAPPKSIWRIA